MSAPTTVILYKGEKEIGREFYNIGWFADDVRLSDDLSEMMNRFGADSILAYGKTYTADRLIQIKNKTLAHREKKRLEREEAHRAMLSKMRPGNAYPVEFVIKIAKGRAPLPEVTAEDIIGVQPMTAPAGQIFKLKRPDAIKLVEALENPPEPNERFLAAARRHSEWTKLSIEEQEAALKDDYDLNKEIIEMIRGQFMNNAIENAKSDVASRTLSTTEWGALTAALNDESAPSEELVKLMTARRAVKRTKVENK